MNKKYLLLFVAAAAIVTLGAGCTLFNTNTTQTTSTSTPVSTASVPADANLTVAFPIKELNITFNVPAIYKNDFAYQIKQINPNGLVAYVYSKSVMAKDNACGAGSVGAISKGKKTYTPAGEERNPVVGVDIKVGDEYVSMDGPQDFCTQNKEWQKAVNDRTEALRQALGTVTLLTDAPAAITLTNVNYFIPKDIAAYMRAEEAYAQTGEGKDPALTVVYLNKTTSVTSLEDPMRVAVQSALALLPTNGGPAHANMIYLRVVNKTAYVMLDIDFNGWAGVAAVQAAIQPVIKKNLLQFSSVKNVVFGPAPGDTREEIGKTVNNS